MCAINKTDSAIAKPRPVPPEALDLLHFWQEAGLQGHWFSKNPRFDAEFHDRFLSLHEAAVAGLLDDWRTTPQAALALLILLDQFPRNAFRGTPRMYASDTLALELAHQMLNASMDAQLLQDLRLFCYLPLSHAEHPHDQAKAVQYNRSLGEPFLHHALEHEEVIRRFGRFPHRNPILGRESTPPELAFLAQGGFAG